MVEAFSRIYFFHHYQKKMQRSISCRKTIATKISPYLSPSRPTPCTSLSKICSAFHDQQACNIKTRGNNRMEPGLLLISSIWVFRRQNSRPIQRKQCNWEVPQPHAKFCANCKWQEAAVRRKNENFLKMESNKVGLFLFPSIRLRCPTNFKLSETLTRHSYLHCSRPF